MPVCLIALGSNLGDRKQQLQDAVALLQAHPDITVQQVSAFYETQPIGGPEQQHPFLNAAARLETALTPQGLMDCLLQIENQLGRQRKERWGSRLVDLDLLLYGDKLVGEFCNQYSGTPDSLIVPHPRMTFRRFVLEPAADVAGELQHPQTGWTLQKHLEHLDCAPQLVVLDGGSQEQRQALTAAIAQHSFPVELVAPFFAYDEWLWQLFSLVVSDQQRTDYLLDYLDTCIESLDLTEKSVDGGWAVCQFWFDCARVLMDLLLSEQYQHQVENRVEAIQKQLPLPKLVVRLQTTSRTWKELGQTLAQSSSSVASTQLWENEWMSFWDLRRQQIAKSSPAPQLIVPGEDHDLMVSEVVAALQATMPS